MRLAVVATGSYAEVQTTQSSRRISVAALRGTVFDCNMIPLTNNKKKIMAAVSPTPCAVTGISTLLEGEKLDEVLNRLKSGNTAVCEVSEKPECNGIAYTDVYEHYGDDFKAEHIIGYIDSSGHGISGIEAAYDDILFSEKTVDAVYTVDGKGDILYGIEPYFENDSSVIGNGVVTTLDINIQSIARSAAEGIECGAVVVAECKSGKIRAMVSRPNFEVSDISKYLSAENSPLLNRALAAYSVGSAFKPCVAAAALEKEQADLIFECTGSTFIIDRNFNCHNRSGHGAMNLKKALAFSCNSFFYNLAISIGADSVYKTARSLSFGSSIKIGDNLTTSAGSITERKPLDNPAALANLSIGQGDLTVSPVAMLNLYNAIASNGKYYLPSVIEATVVDGSVSPYDIGSPTMVMSESTAAVLREYLIGVIADGTGIAAAPRTCIAAGKTATAQTGRYDKSGNEITNSWFCGFFPAENPRYTVIVMSEGKPSVSTASIFAEIADGINIFEG